MSQPGPALRPSGYRKHRRASKNDWDSGRVREWTRDHSYGAQYSPYLSSVDIEAMERECIQRGKEYRDSEAPHKWKCAMRMDNVVGLCDGEDAEYLLVHVVNNEFHGYPMTKRALNKIGIDLCGR